jgi:hypothetical protein
MNEIDRLVAIEDIRALKARYFRGVDTKDWALLGEVMAEDVTCDYRGSATDPATGVNFAPAATGEPLSGSAAVIAGLQHSLAGIVSAHQGYLPELSILDEHTAEGIWAMYDTLRFPPGHELSELSGFGHYFERYQKIGRKWRIRTLKLVRIRVDIVKARG